MPASVNQNAEERPRTDGAHVSACQPAAEVIRVSSPASLLAAVPVMLGFEPAEHSIVVLGTAPPHCTVRIALRYDIPDWQHVSALATHAASILGAQEIAEAYAVGYGPVDLVAPAVGLLQARLTGVGITVRELLRVQDGRYWSYICANPGCCPPEGTAFNTKSHPITRKHAGRVLASREALAATVAPVTGDTADSMREATRAAEKRAARLVRAARRSRRPVTNRRALLQPGLQAVADAISLYRDGGQFESHEDAAWLALALEDMQVRDDAWARMDPGHRKAHSRLWTDLTTLARPGYSAPPAALLAFTAWQDGDGALANVALDRALEDDPQYSMAQLLRDALDAGAPPSMARLPMTPEDVAAAYDARETPEETAGQADGGSGEDGEEGDGEHATAEDSGGAAAPAELLATKDA